MEKLQYKISSRATILLGRESISRIESAVTEIVKNTYDADASMCFLTFDIPNDCIYIFDNGIGMTRKSIEENWMLIGTDNKRVEYQSAKGRVRAGEKGIGRFALDRMGSICEMYTKTENANSTLHWTTNWEMFEESGRLLDDMYATLEELPQNILNCLPPAISSRVESFCRAQANDATFTSGTCFVIRSPVSAYIARMFAMAFHGPETKYINSICDERIKAAIASRHITISEYMTDGFCFFDMFDNSPEAERKDYLLGEIRALAVQIAEDLDVIIRRIGKKYEKE